MNDWILSLITVFIYIGITVFEALRFAGKINLFRLSAIFFGYIAISLHGLLLYWWVDTATGQNLAFFNMISLMTWLVAVLVMFAALYKSVDGLIILICPLAGISILLVMFFPAENVIDTGANPKQLIHILLAVLTVSVLCVAALQAILLALQEYQLRYKRGIWWWKNFPPLETMETFLFQMIGFGFALLSIVIVTSLSFFHALLVHQMAQKAVIVVLAWFVFAGLIVGRCFFGWRGRKAIYGTLSGVGLLILAYWSSKLILEAAF